MLATLIQRYYKKKIIHFKSETLIEILPDCQVPHFIVVFIPYEYINLLFFSWIIKCLFFKEDGAFKLFWKPGPVFGLFANMMFNPYSATGPILGHRCNYVQCQRANFGPVLLTKMERYLRGKILNIIRFWPDKSFENILQVPKVGYVCLNVREKIKQAHTLSAFLWLTILFSRVRDITSLAAAGRYVRSHVTSRAVNLSNLV